MKTLPLPYNNEGLYVMDAAEEIERSRTSAAWVARLHVIATTIMCLLALLCGLTGYGNFGWAMAMSLGILCLVALVLGHLLSMPIGDLYRQFHYREKFLLFLAHVGILLGARYIVGITQWPVVLGIFLVFLCVQGIDRIFYGRIHAGAMAIVFYACAFAPHKPMAYLVVLWFIFLLVAVRLGHVHFRVSEHGEDAGADLMSTLRRSVLFVCIPALASYATYYVLNNRLTPRRFTFQPGYVERDGKDIFLSYSQIIWDAFFFIVAIIALLVLLNWIEKKLKRRGKGTEIPGGEMPTAMREFRPGDLRIDDLEIDTTEGPRERVLRAFQMFSERLTRIEYGRGESETAADYVTRLARLFPPVDRIRTGTIDLFEDACYDRRPIDEKEADSFVALLEGSLRHVREELEKVARASRP